MQFLRNFLRLTKVSPSVETTTSSSTSLDTSTATKFRIGWATDVGKMRRHNEDAILILATAHDGEESLPPFGLFILADGMGGHQAGEVASSLAARTVAHYIVQQLYLPSLIDQGHKNQLALNEALVNAVQAANNAVTNKAPGAGTTLTCALMLGPRAYIAHVGDSRAYLVAEEGLDQITHDHSLVDRLVELGQLTRDEAAIHPQKNVLYRAIGQNGTLEVDTYVRTIPENGHLLLCSDGLWSMIHEIDMINIVTTTTSPQAACEDLITAANHAGGNDNITAILVAPPLSQKAV